MQDSLLLFSEKHGPREEVSPSFRVAQLEKSWPANFPGSLVPGPVPFSTVPGVGTGDRGAPHLCQVLCLKAIYHICVAQILVCHPLPWYSGRCLLYL